jgi:hypothetical protein
MNKKKKNKIKYRNMLEKTKKLKHKINIYIICIYKD